MPPLFLGGQCFVPRTLRLIENLLTRLFWKITPRLRRAACEGVRPGMVESEREPAEQATEQEEVPREEQVPQCLEIRVRVVRVHCSEYSGLIQTHVRIVRKLPQAHLLHSLTHAPTHTPTHAPAHPLTDSSLAHSLTHPPTHPPTHPLTHPLTHVRMLTCALASLTRSAHLLRAHPLTHPPTHSPTHYSPTHSSLARSLTHSLTHSPTHALVCAS